MNKKILFSLCLLIFVDAIGAGLIFPIMPELFLNSQYGLVKSNSFLSSNILYGLSFGLFPLASFFGMPLLGSLSDQYGRRKIMLLGLVGICLSDLLACFSILVRDPYIFLLSRLTMGFCSGTYIVANAVIADLSTSVKSKMNNFRWPMLSSIAGFVLGPLIGSSSVIAKGIYSLTTPFIIVLCLSLFNLALIYLSFRDISLDKSLEKTKTFKAQVRAIIDIFTDKSLRFLTISYSLFQFAIGLFIQSISLFLASSFNYSTKIIGIFFTVMCLGLTLNILIIQPILTKYVEVRRLIIFSIVIISIMLLIQGLSIYIGNGVNIKAIIWVASLVLYIFMPFSNTGYMAVYSDYTDKKEQGKAMGSLGQITSLMMFIASFFIGFLVLAHEPILLILAGILALIGALLLYIQFLERDV
ncbi:MFS transporter [Francisella sp. 19X1-34]|uniref:MFS transporter n=1 Tax=Francisella sp. 19X1-34 TaxID=3087177 RepID=UPI002E309079|nr:MFS transporter [Francisella sp. 19X1-34]MED7789341.1 MFS transporter [Francisella sp. 19X1-34]